MAVLHAIVKLLLKLISTYICSNYTYYPYVFLPKQPVFGATLRFLMNTTSPFVSYP